MTQQELLPKTKSGRKRATKRVRRIIVAVEENVHALLEATAQLAGYQGIEEYASEAILQRFEMDRERCRAAMERHHVE